MDQDIIHLGLLFFIIFLNYLYLIFTLLTKKISLVQSLLLFKFILALCLFCLLESGSDLELNLIAFDKEEIGLSFDKLGLIYVSMINIIGWVVSRYSYTYLEGDLKRLKFMKNLHLCLFFIEAFVLSDSFLIYIVTLIGINFFLDKLLMYYDSRPQTIRVAKNRRWMSRISEVLLIIACILFYNEFGSFEIDGVMENIILEKNNFVLELSGFFLMLSAFVMAAQIPFHGWILEVMEAPTPVSALLHAGIINAGPFLIIRFANFFNHLEYIPAILILISSASAIFGAICYTSQSEIKRGLSFSSISHMGFSLTLAGMGLYPMALLHTIGHSFFKAHAFLSSGSYVDLYRLGLFGFYEKRLPSLKRTFLGFILAVLIFIIYVKSINIEKEGIHLIFLGAIIFFGLTALIIRSLNAGVDYVRFYFKMLLMLLLLIISFYVFEFNIAKLMKSIFPDFVFRKNYIAVYVWVFVLFLFTFVFTMSTLHTTKYFNKKWIIYSRNGFYLHLLFDRLIKN